MRKEKKPFQEKKIQSRSQSYCAFWTKRTMCLATESFCISNERRREKKILWSTFLSCSGLSVCACVIFSRIFSCRKYPWEVTNTILEGLWVGAQKGAASDGANQSNKAHGHFSPWRQKRREITRAVSKNSLGIDPLSRWVLWQIPIVGTLQPLPVRS